MLSIIIEKEDFEDNCLYKTRWDSYPGIGYMMLSVCCFWIFNKKKRCVKSWISFFLIKMIFFPHLCLDMNPIWFCKGSYLQNLPFRKTDLIERYILHRKPKDTIYVRYFSILLYLLNIQVALTEKAVRHLGIE
jgi:hypothetical protein